MAHGKPKHSGKSHKQILSMAVADKRREKHEYGEQKHGGKGGKKYDGKKAMGC